jgi:hypothetical protein
VLDVDHQKQSVPIACHLFHTMVAQKAQDLGYLEEAKAITVIQNWIDAYDKHGLTLTQQKNYIVQMDTFLLSKLTKPFSISHATASYIAGMSQEVFEESLVLNQGFCNMLDSLDEYVRIQFNSRVMSTDPVECFFSVL